MPRYEFTLDLTQEEVLLYYRGRAHLVTARMPDRRTIQFPANLLVRHVRYDGVAGRFALTTDENNRAVALERLAVAS